MTRTKGDTNSEAWPQHLRIPLLEPFTPMQALVVALVVRGCTYPEIGQRLHIARPTIEGHMKLAAEKIPGDLRPSMKIHFWARGARLDQLTGEGWMPGPPDSDVI